MSAYDRYTTWAQIYEDARQGEVYAVEALKLGVMKGNDNARPYLDKLNNRKVARQKKETPLAYRSQEA